MPSSSSSTGTLGAAMMSIAIGKGCKIIVNRIVKRMSKPKMDVSRTVVPRKKLQILINGHKPDKWSFWIYYSWRLLSMAFAVAVVFALSKDINHIIADWTSGWTVNLDFFALLDNHPWVNLLLFIWLLVGVAFYVWKNWKNKYFSLVGVGVASAVSILVLRQGVWKYATTPIGFLNYDWFVAIVAWGFIVWSLSRCLTFKHWYERKTKKKVMTSDEIEGVKISPARQVYAKMLVDELLTSNLRNETYAVAITGSWGSGKSLFLNTIKSLCKDKTIVIDFNPWNSQSDEHLVKDFFNELAVALSPYYGGVKKLMDKYVSLIYSLRLNVASGFVFQHFPGNKESNLESKKQEVAKALRNIQKPIVVAIDDLDRLAGREIFEVLRIIRNTAKFNNIIYFVTYDKEHVVSQLSLPGLGIEKDYLEKIFQIELSMPEVDDKVLVEDFQLLCRNGVKKTSLINGTLAALSEEDYGQILKTLWSYRKLRRFVRQFTFNANYMIESFVDGTDLSLRDVLFLNIIQTIDYQLYQKMWLTPEVLFDVKVQSYSKRQYYALKNNTNEQAVSYYFMKKLFGDEPDNGANGIQMVDSYYKFFYLAQPGKSLSKEEFEEMLKLSSSENATVGMRSTIRNWVLSKDSKNAPSIYSCFVKSKPKVHVDSAEAKAFLTALFYWLEYEERENANLEDVLPHLLIARLYNIKPDQQIGAFVMSLMNKWLYKGSHEKCAKMLARLYVEVESGTKLLLDKSQVKKAITNNMDLFLKSQEWDAVLLFKGDDNPMLRMTKAYCVKTPNQMGRINLVIDQLIDYFSRTELVSQNLSQVEKYKGLFDLYKVSGKQANSSVNWDEMISIFGDDLSKAYDYIDKCFRQRDGKG